MTRVHHPADREERLANKKIRYEKQKKAASSEARANQVRLRRIREELKDKETQDALRSHSE